MAGPAAPPTPDFEAGLQKPCGSLQSLRMWVSSDVHTGRDGFFLALALIPSAHPHPPNPRPHRSRGSSCGSLRIGPCSEMITCTKRCRRPPARMCRQQLHTPRTQRGLGLLPTRVFLPLSPSFPFFLFRFSGHTRGHVEAPGPGIRAGSSSSPRWAGEPSPTSTATQAAAAGFLAHCTTAGTPQFLFTAHHFLFV